MQEMRFRPGLHPDPAGEGSLERSPDPLAGLRGLLLWGGDGMGAYF